MAMVRCSRWRLTRTVLPLAARGPCTDRDLMQRTAGTPIWPDLLVERTGEAALGQSRGRGEEADQTNEDYCDER
jgi:hypothetical protein